MSDLNKAVVRRFFEETDKGNLDVADELWSSNHVFHMPGSPPMDAAGHKQLLAMYQTAFGDWRQEIEAMIAEDDRVVTMFRFHGTHKGELMGIPPTGKTVDVTAVAIDRISEGRIAEEWTVFDGVGMLQQLGAMPAAQ